MKKLIAAYFLLAFGVTTLIQPSRSFARADDVVELRCAHRKGHSANREEEVNAVTINLPKQEIRLWITEKDDGWVFGNFANSFLEKRVATSLQRDSRGVIDGTGHNYFVAAAFRYEQKDGRFLWVWIGGSGTVYQLEYNCWRID